MSPRALLAYKHARLTQLSTRKQMKPTKWVNHTRPHWFSSVKSRAVKVFRDLKEADLYIYNSMLLIHNPNYKY